MDEAGRLEGTIYRRGDYVIELAPFRKMRSIIRFQAIAQAGKIEDLMTECARVILAWPFDGDPGDIESYLDLDIADWTQVQEVVADAMTNIFQSAGARR